MRYCALIILISLITGCAGKDSEQGKTHNDTLSVQNDTVENKGSDNLKVPQKINLSTVNLGQIKSDYADNNTSGVLSANKSDQFQFNAQDGFIGIYYFIGKESSLPYVGQAIVAVTNPKNQWNYNNDYESLLEFTVYSNELNPFSSIIEIGESEETIIEIFGSDFKRLNSTLVYKQKNEEIASFLIKKNKVVAIRVGFYKNIDEVQPIEMKW